MISHNATVHLIGNLGQNPDIRNNENGDYTFLSIATSDTFQDPATDTYWRQPTVWHRIAVYNPLPLERIKRLQKGKRNQVEAPLDYYKTKAFVEGEERTLSEPKLVAKNVSLFTETPERSHPAA